MSNSIIENDVRDAALIAETSYLNVLRKLCEIAPTRDDRTGVGTSSMFGGQVRIPLPWGYIPMLLSKSVHWKSMARELLWMLSGSTNVKDLQKHGVTIWDEWANSEGDLGPVYGAQWRAFGNCYPYIDQIRQAEMLIKEQPNSRRIVVSTWNPPVLPNMALPPCHVLFQFYVKDGKLSCHMYQRSVDWFLGAPFNIASYALLTHIMAHVTGLVTGDLVISYGDMHLYSNHREAARIQLDREYEVLAGIQSGTMKLPTVQVKTVRPPSIDYVMYEDLVLHDYNPMPSIKAPVAV